MTLSRITDLTLATINDERDDYLRSYETDGELPYSVAVVEFGCFQCPFCAHLARELKMLKGRFGSDLSFSFKAGLSVLVSYCKPSII